MRFYLSTATRPDIVSFIDLSSLRGKRVIAIIIKKNPSLRRRQREGVPAKRRPGELTAKRTLAPIAARKEGFVI
jgi:hypothetical protein